MALSPGMATPRLSKVFYIFLLDFDFSSDALPLLVQNPLKFNKFSELYLRNHPLEEGVPSPRIFVRGIFEEILHFEGHQKDKEKADRDPTGSGSQTEGFPILPAWTKILFLQRLTFRLVARVPVECTPSG